MTETRTLIGEEKGWRIIAVNHTTYEAKKDGESVVLAAGMIHDILELIGQRERMKETNESMGRRRNDDRSQGQNS